MITLYNEYEMLNPTGSEISTYIEIAMAQVIKEYPELSLIDFESVAIRVIVAITGEERLRRSIAKRKKERNVQIYN
jgi:hypothetical protein